MLDQGAQGIMVPQVNSRAEAERVVAACKYAPEGMRGMATARGADFGVTKAFKDIIADVNREVLVIVQCENIIGVNALDDILQVKGIDVVYIGPSDLSQSLGKPAQYDAPEVVAAIETIIARCKRAGVTVGIYPGTASEARRYAAMGVTMQGVGDIGFLADGARAWLRGAKNL